MIVFVAYVDRLVERTSHFYAKKIVFQGRRLESFKLKRKLDLGYVVVVGIVGLVVRVVNDGLVVVVGLMMVGSVRVRQLMGGHMRVRHRLHVHHVHVVHGLHVRHGLLHFHLHVLHVLHHGLHHGLLFHLHVVHHHGHWLLGRGDGLGLLHHVFGHVRGVVPHVLDERMVLIMKSVVLSRGQGGQENHQFELQLDFG